MGYALISKFQFLLNNLFCDEGEKMETLLKTLLLIGTIITIITAQITENVQFKDISGENYDLYELLDRGTYVVVHTQYNS